MSIERLLLALEAEGKSLDLHNELDVYIVAMDEAAKVKAVELASTFRTKGIAAEIDYAQRKMKAQMKAADRLQAKFVLILGENELQQQAAAVKEMATGEQQTVAFSELVTYLQGKLGGQA